MGVDHGTHRVGIALSDRLAITAQPHAVVPAPQAVEAIARLMAEQDVERIVVGLPLTLSGREGRAAEQARQFAADLEEATGLPVELWDERLTTSTAEKALLESGMKRRRRRFIVDKVAAAIMLQSYLDRAGGHRVPQPGDK